MEKVLIVEDDLAFAEDLRQSIIKIGYNVTSIEETGAGALKSVEENKPDLILMDIILKGEMTGIEAAHHIHNHFNIPHIFISAYCDNDRLEAAGKSGSDGYLVKPINDNTLKAALKTTLYKHNMEQQLREKDKFIHNVFESIDDGLVIIDREYRIIAANRIFCEQHGMSPDNIKDQYCFSVTHHCDTPCFESGEDCAVKKTFDTEQPHTAIHRHFDTNGKPIYVALRASPMKDNNGHFNAVIETSLNITENRKLQAQLQQAQKMETVGQLAGGIAHDFNNIMAAIINWGFLLMKNAESEKQRQGIQHILESADRAAQLTAGLLAYSRKQMINPSTIRLNNIITKVVQLVHSIIPENIATSIILTEKDTTVWVDSIQIEQALLNLITNARDSMPHGGTLKISTEIYEIGRDFIKSHGYGEPGMYAMVSVADDGSGIDEESQQKIFEPFYTTKEVGKGTGLGLSIIYGIMKQNNGYVNVHSKPEMGSEFKLYFPLAAAKINKETKTASSAITSGTETILYAEDNQLARESTTAILESLGYIIIEAADGEEALIQFSKHQDKIQLLLLDQLMPKKNGREVYEEAKKIIPDIKALFLSGYSQDILHTLEPLVKGINYLSKPASPDELAMKIRGILDENSKVHHK